ncbi:unnamed protein product [Boreogadus saida]
MWPPLEKPPSARPQRRVPQPLDPKSPSRPHSCTLHPAHLTSRASTKRQVTQEEGSPALAWGNRIRPRPLRPPRDVGWGSAPHNPPALSPLDGTLEGPPHNEGQGARPQDPDTPRLSLERLGHRSLLALEKRPHAQTLSSHSGGTTDRPNRTNPRKSRGCQPSPAGTRYPQHTAGPRGAEPILPRHRGGEPQTALSHTQPWSLPPQAPLPGLRHNRRAFRQYDTRMKTQTPAPGAPEISRPRVPCTARGPHALTCGFRHGEGR